MSTTTTADRISIPTATFTMVSATIRRIGTRALKNPVGRKRLMEELHTDSIDGASSAIYGLGHVPGGGRHSNTYHPLAVLGREMFSPMYSMEGVKRLTNKVTQSSLCSAGRNSRFGLARGEQFATSSKKCRKTLGTKPAGSLEPCHIMVLTVFFFRELVLCVKPDSLRPLNVLNMSPDPIPQ
jgi:hypothetical protein